MYQALEHSRGRPIIVDERPLLAIAAPRRRSPSRSRHAIWDSPSTSHASFNSRLRREEEELRLRQREIDIEREAERRKRAFIRAQDDDIRRRPVVPMPPLRRAYTKPVVTVVDQADLLPEMMGGLSFEESKYDRVRREQAEVEAQKQRLRERQLPKRRASVGPGYRRHRVAYDDGLYRWE